MSQTHQQTGVFSSLPARRDGGYDAAVARLCQAACLAAVFAAVALADVVVLENGDRITGEVQRLEKQRLVVKTAWAGTIQVDWGAVRQVWTDRPLEVELDSGQLLKGKLRSSASGLQVLTEKKPVPLVPRRVQAMTAIPARPQNGFWRSLQGSLDFGHSLARGNSNFNQSSIGFNARYRAGSTMFKGSLLSLVSLQSKAPATNRLAASVRYEVPAGPQTFAFALTGFEHDDRQHLNRRWNLGGGWGWRIVRSPRRELALLGGFTYADERFRIFPRASGEALAVLDLENFSVGRARLYSKLSLYPDLLGGDRYRIAFDAGLRVPLAGQFTWNVRLFDRFDSRPPLPVRRNDYGIVNGLGISLGQRGRMEPNPIREMMRAAHCRRAGAPGYNALQPLVSRGHDAQKLKKECLIRVLKLDVLQHEPIAFDSVLCLVK